MGLWETLHNPDFNPIEFEGFRKQYGANAFTMSPKKWIEATNAIGIISKSGRYGYNAILINQGLKQDERIEKLRELAISQLKTLNSMDVQSLAAHTEEK